MKRTRHGVTNRRAAVFVSALLALAVLVWTAERLGAQDPTPTPPTPAPSSGPRGTPSLGPPQAPGLGGPGAPGQPTPVLPPVVIAPGEQPPPLPATIPPVPRFQFKIDPKTPLKELLPTAPKARKVGPLLSDDLGKVPEIEFQAPLARNLGP